MSKFYNLFKYIGAILIIGLLLLPEARAQHSVGIGTAEPNPNAILDLKADKQGLLVPRLSSSQRVQMAQILNSSSGNEGMIVFDTDQGKFYYWFDSEWKEGLGAIASSEIQGDLEGNIPAPLVVGLQGRAISNAAPATDQVLKWNGTAWSPSVDVGEEYTGGAGIQINDGQVINTGDLDGDDDVLVTDNAGGDLTGTFSNLNIQNSAISTNKIANAAVTSDKISNNAITTEKIADEAISSGKIAPGSPNTVLGVGSDGAVQWEDKRAFMGTQLEEGKVLIGNSSGDAEAQTLSGDVLLAADGEITIQDNAVNSEKILNESISTEDIASDAITREKIAADVAGTGLSQDTDGSIRVNAGTGLNVASDALNLSNTGVTTGDYGQKDKVAQFTVDAQGRIVAASELDIEALPVGPAGGDLSGDYPNPTIKDGVITQAKIANDAVGVLQIRNDDPNAILITDPSGNPRWFETYANHVIVTSVDGQIIQESRNNFATSSLQNGYIFIGGPDNKATSISASTTGNILIGNGSGMSSVDVSGDIDIAITGVSTIQLGAVNNSKLANNAVTSDKIVDGTIVNADLAANSVNSGNIVDGTVVAGDLATDAVTTIKIADGAVTTAKILNGTIANEDLNKSDIPLSGFGAAEGNVDLGTNKLVNVANPTDDQDAATKNYVDAQITSSTTLAEGHVYIGDDDDKATAIDASTSGNILVGDGATVNSVGVTGDVTLAADGTTTISNDVITSDNIVNGTIINEDLAANSVNSSNVIDGSIVTADLATDAVTTIKIADGAVTTAKILDGTIANEDLNKSAIPLSGFGAAEADVDLDTHRLVNVANPTDDQDAATKNYVDAQITSSTTLAEGHVYIGDAGDKATAVDASTLGNILVGDGATVNSVGVTGDVTLAANGTTTISNDVITSDNIVDGTIVNADLAANSVNSSNIIDGSIVTTDLATDAVTTIKIADGAVTTAKILNGTIANEDLNKSDIPLSGFGAAEGNVDLGTNKLVNVANPTDDQDAATKNYVDTQITSSTTLAEGHVYIGDDDDKATAVDASTSGNILVGDGATVNSVGVTGDVTLAANGTITIQDAAVTSAKIADGTITTTDLGNGSVTNLKLAADAVTSDKIDDGTIVNADLAANSVNSSNVVDGSIVTADLANEAVTNTKIADGAVTTAKILNGTIANEDLNKSDIPLSGFGAAEGNVDLGTNKLVNVANPTDDQDAATKNYVDTQITSSTTLAEGHVYIGDDDDKATAVDASTSGNILVGDGATVNSVGVTGDVTLAADGTTTISNDVITSDNIVNGTIINEDLAANSVNSSNIVDGSIVTADLATDAITTIKITDEAITTAKILDGTIANEDLNKADIPLSGFGAAEAEVSLGTNKLVNVANPTDDQDAATKSYVDAASAADGDKDATNEIQDLSLLNNSLTLSGDATPVDLSAYLDNTDDQQLSLDGNNLELENGGSVDLSGYLDNTDNQDLANVLSLGNDAGNRAISNLADPTNDQDAATKNYVDELYALDGDKSSTNESLTAATLNGTTLELTESGNLTTVDMSSLLSSGTRGSLWRQGATAPVPLGTELVGDKYLHTGNGEIWNFNGTTWENTSQSIRGPQGSQGPPGVGIGTVSPGNGIKITGNFLAPSTIAVIADESTLGFTGNAGDSDRKLRVMDGGIGSSQIVDNAISTTKIQNSAITAAKMAQNGASSGQVLKWNGSAWVASDDNVNDGDSSPTNEIQSLNISGNAISISSGNSVNISSIAPSENQVLTWQSGEWKAATVTAGAGVTTKTSYYSIDPLDFRGLGQDGSQKIYYYNGAEGAEFVATDAEYGIGAPVHLPHGAIVESVTFYYSDNSSSDIAFTVQRKERAGGNSQNIATHTSSGTPGNTSASAISISNGTIDNSLYTYRLIVDLEKDSYSGSASHHIYSVVIQYTENVGGINVPAGAVISRTYTGNTTPSNALGENGDFYVDESSDRLFIKYQGIWTRVTNL